MKKLLILAVSMLTVVALAGVSVAADATSAPAKPAHAKKMSTPKTTMGEVTAVAAGKNFSVKDEKGKIRKFDIGKHTKIDGELKVGAKVSVTSMGRWAEGVKVEGSPAPTAAPAASKPPAEKY
jgi:curli biogenesis system outer membrane secretion channel CsgG